MNTTPKLHLPYILTAQAQKEVTHNEALNLLDMYTRPVVQVVGQDVPPVSPVVGECYTVGSSPSDVFIGHEQEIACYTVNGWLFASPFKWLEVVNESDNARYIYDGTGWVPFGLIMQASGEYLRVERFAETVTCSGVSVNLASQIPDRATVLAVNARVTTAITGASSFDIGVAGDAARYGNDLGIALGTTNIGLSQHPYAYYADTPLTLTANGSNFTGGVVEVAVQYLSSGWGA